MPLTSDDIINLSREGLIAGPGESETEFEKRILYCKGLQRELDIPSANISEAKPITKKWFDITPSWVPCFFSNHQLSYWQGGCAWIFQQDDQTPTGAFLQLRKTFEQKSTFLGIYKRDEFIAHELCHVGRMMFEEPKFEEVLAYQTASSPFQRYFGPILRTSGEAILFAIILMMLVLIDVMTIVTGSYSLYEHLMWLKLVPVGLILFALGRLIWTQNQFKRCRKSLKKTLSSEQDVNAVIFRLTDHEIEQFQTMSPEDIRSYGERMAHEELRWKQIFPYFSQKRNK